jgi:hypothetical protein
MSFPLDDVSCLGPFEDCEVDTHGSEV